MTAPRYLTLADNLELMQPNAHGRIVLALEKSQCTEIVAALRLAAKPADEGSPDDIRAMGWMVAVHNDYRQLGEPHTFWLFTKDGRAVKGEGMSDAEALNKVRAALSTTGEPKP